MIRFIVIFAMSLLPYLSSSHAQLALDHTTTVPAELSNSSPIMIIRFNKEEAVNFTNTTQKMVKAVLKTNAKAEFVILTVLNTTKTYPHNTDLDNIIASSIEKLTKILLAEGVSSNNIHHFTEVKNTTSEPNQIRIFIK